MSVEPLVPDPEDLPPLVRGNAQPSPSRTWYVSPPELMRWLAPQARDHAIALLELEPDVLPTGELRVDLQVALKCFAVRQEGMFAQADFYFGCSSASVELSVEGETINAYTHGKELTVNHKDVHTRTRASKASLEPSLEFKSQGREDKFSAGSISLDSGSESVFESSFSYSERYLEAVNVGSGVIWRLDPPNQKHVVRDFLFCNLHVYVECTNSGPCHGRVRVRPSDLRLFGPDRRPFGKAKSLMLHFALRKHRKALFRPRGIEVQFTEEAP